MKFRPNTGMRLCTVGDCELMWTGKRPHEDIDVSVCLWRCESLRSDMKRSVILYFMSPTLFAVGFNIHSALVQCYAACSVLFFFIPEK